MSTTCTSTAGYGGGAVLYNVPSSDMSAVTVSDNVVGESKDDSGLVSPRFLSEAAFGTDAW